jgi:hypothetical protein
MGDASLLNAASTFGVQADHLPPEGQEATGMSIRL